ncbi:VanZ family protein [Patescibacteria group bacterium]|nr:VanZ family protein [Patescibacteria group bacterium]
MTKKIKKYALLIIWCGVLFLFSSIPNAKISTDTLMDLIIRKSLHFTNYFILYVIAYKTFNKKGLKTLIFCAIYALSDEAHQFFVEGRGPSLWDALIDTLGAFFGMIVIWNNWNQHLLKIILKLQKGFLK